MPRALARRFITAALAVALSAPALAAQQVDPRLDRLKDEAIQKVQDNGKMVQEAHTGQDLMFSVAYQIADLARHITLLPGDLILTGTPANSRPVEPGDVVEVEVSGIGRLSNTVVEMARDLVKVGFQPQITPNTLHVALAMPEDEAEKRVSEYQ